MHWGTFLLLIKTTTESAKSALMEWSPRLLVRVYLDLLMVWEFRRSSLLLMVSW
jgi:hypothetical protein